MDLDQIGSAPNQFEIELLYNEVLTAFADSTGFEAKRDDAIKSAVAKAKRFHEIVGPDNWEPLLNTKGIKRKGRATGRFQPLLRHAMPRTSGWVSKVASVLDEAVEKNIPAERICNWITQSPKGINGIYERRRQRKKAEERATKGLPPLQTKEQKRLAYDELLSMDFISEHELPEAWRDRKARDPVSRVAVEAFEVVLAARFENGKFKVRGYFVPGSNFWIGKADELVRSRGIEPNGDSSLKKNLQEEPCAPDQAAVAVENVPAWATETEARTQERPTLIEQQHSPPPAQGPAVTTQADPLSTVIENRPPASRSAESSENRSRWAACLPCAWRAMYIRDVQRRGSVLDAGNARAQSLGQAHSVRDPASFRERRSYHSPRSAQAYWGALAKPTSDHCRRLTRPSRPPPSPPASASDPALHGRS